MEIPFQQARFFTRLPAPRDIGLIVIHCAEVPELAGKAMWLMDYCSNEDRRASWHYAVDSDAITQSVLEPDVAWHAGHSANLRSVGIELATFGEPTPAEWGDAYSKKMLDIAAFLAAGICARLKIDPVFVDAAGLVQVAPLRRGITTHAECSKAFPQDVPPGENPHMDPGPDFPMDSFLADVAARIASGNHQ